mgnify:FL=1
MRQLAGRLAKRCRNTNGKRVGKMNKAIAVIPFFERLGEDQGDWSAESYVAGFRKADGSPASVQVVMPTEMVEQAVLAKARLSLSMNADGTFTLHADGLNDDALDAGSRSCLAKQSLQSLLDECLQADMVAMEDDPAADLGSLRAQLAAGLALVDRALEALGNK